MVSLPGSFMIKDKLIASTISFIGDRMALLQSHLCLCSDESNVDKLSLLALFCSNNISKLHWESDVTIVVRVPLPTSKRRSANRQLEHHCVNAPAYSLTDSASQHDTTGRKPSVTQLFHQQTYFLE